MHLQSLSEIERIRQQYYEDAADRLADDLRYSDYDDDDDEIPRCRECGAELDDDNTKYCDDCL